MEDCVMEDCDNHLQQPWEEAKPKKKTTETLPDDFSTLCRVTITTDGGGGGGVEAVMQEIEGEAQEKQQQHGEGKQLKKKMMKKKNDKKKKKKNKRGPLRASNTRSFTPEEKEAYHKQVEETEGFGVLDLPFDVITQDVVPCPPRDTDEVMLYRGMAKKALGFYNDDNNGTSYKFVRLIRTNCCCHYVNRTEFFITFQAKDGRAGEMHNFQAHILYFKGETCPLFCRLEPKSKLPEGPFRFLYRTLISQPWSRETHFRHQLCNEDNQLSYSFSCKIAKCMLFWPSGQPRYCDPPLVVL